jgi:hypothetical protein
MFKIFNAKYRFFKKKISDVQKTIWEREFKVVKSRQVREGVRQDRDRAIEALNSMKNQKDVATKEVAEKEQAAFEDNIKRYEAQMAMIDKQINGYTAKNENEESVVGLLEEIRSYIELREMYKQYISEI